MTPNKNFMGLFMMFLVLMLPFYSANALAVSVSVTRNEGTDEIPDFINSDGDTWTVEATINDPLETTIDPQNVKMRISSIEIPFNSCAAASLGITCQYEDDLPDGIAEGSYPFEVSYYYLDENDLQTSQLSPSETIHADGAGPRVTNVDVVQEIDGQIYLDFIATDNVNTGKPFVGLKKIDVVDRDSGATILTIDENYATFELGMERFQYSDALPISLTGEGEVRIRVVAEDLFGHQGESSTRTLEFDFDAPQVDTSSLRFRDVGDFIGSDPITTKMTVNITETGVIPIGAVIAGSDQLRLRDGAGRCADLPGTNVWQCEWNDVILSPEETVTVTITSTDDVGNSAPVTISRNFARDVDPPTIDYFGSVRTYGGLSFVKQTGESKILLRVRDQGIGIEENDLAVNLGAFGSGTRSCEKPEGENGLDCTFKVRNPRSSSGADVAITKLQDAVGNEGDKITLAAMVDGTSPIIEKLALKGVSDIGPKDYMQSGDQLGIEMTVKEVNGITALVYLNGLVDGAEDLHPENEITKGMGKGWRVFTEEDGCERTKDIEGKADLTSWTCTFLTEAIRSGTGNDVNFRIKLMDTAGNEVRAWPTDNNLKNLRGQNGNFKFKLLGIRDEPNPDFWEVAPGCPHPLKDFIDLETTHLIPTRMPVQVKLRSNESLAKVVRIDLPVNTCRPKDESSPPLIRSQIFSPISFEGVPNPTSQLVLEVQPFDGRAHFGIDDLEEEQSFSVEHVTYICPLRIFTTIGNAAFRSPEIQEVEVKIPFGISTLGALDENLDDKIEDIRDEFFVSLADDLEIVGEVVNYARYFVGILVSLYSVWTLYQIWTMSSDTYRKNPIGGTGVATLVCASGNVAKSALSGVVEGLQVLNGILVCNPNAGDLGWYSKYQQGVLKVYNFISGRVFIGMGATTLYENMWTSIFGICFPGMLHHLELYRQVRCREALCYKRDVPAGLATVGSCRELGSFLECKFFIGPLLKASPLAVVDAIGNFLKSLFSSPLGVIKMVLSLPCVIMCLTESGFEAACQYTAFGLKAIDLIDNAYTTFQSWPGKVGNPYCSQLEDEDDEEETPEEPPEEEET